MKTKILWSWAALALIYILLLVAGNFIQWQAAQAFDQAIDPVKKVPTDREKLEAWKNGMAVSERMKKASRILQIVILLWIGIGLFAGKCTLQESLFRIWLPILAAAVICIPIYLKSGDHWSNYYLDMMIGTVYTAAATVIFFVAARIQRNRKA